MTVRELEAELIDKCAQIAKGTAEPQNVMEANVASVAGMVVFSHFPQESRRLTVASSQYFAAKPGDKIPPVEVIRKGWIISLPRLRDALSRKFQP